MLSLSKTPASRCLASRQGRNARPAISSASLLQGQRRPLRPIAAIPGEPDKDFGLAPESGTGGSGLGRSQGTARPLSGADNAGIGSAPESGTRSDEGIPSSISSAGRSNEDSWAAQQAGQDVQSPTGKSSSSMTGQMPGGQHEVSAGWDVPSSDTHPEMDPAESKKYTERETQGSTSVPSGGSGSQSQEMRQQDSGSGHRHGRDESDAHMGGEDSGGSETRSHPVARTAATAIGSAAGTLLGAVGGPVGAAAGAALGGGVGRRIADALGGDEGQAEVYDQGAEPEQVAEELLGARDAVGERLESARDDIKERAHDAKEAVQDKLHRASERTEDASRDAKHRTEDASHDAKQQMNKQQGRARDDDRSNNLQGSVGSRVQFAGEESGRPDTGGRTSSSGSGSGSREHGSGSHEHGSGSREHGSGSHEHGSGSHEHGKGLGGAIADAAKSTAHKLGSAADAVTGHAQFPEFPPAEGKAADGGTMRAADNLADAAKSAANKVASAGEGKASNHDTIGSGSSKGEQGQTADRASTASSATGYSDGKSVGDWVRESADALGDSIADTSDRLGVSSEQKGESAGGLSDALRSAVRTAADCGSLETPERTTEMSAQTEQQQGVQDSSSSGGGVGSSSSSGGLQEEVTWGDVSGLSDALGMGEPVEGGYYAYRSIDDFPAGAGSSSSSGDPLNTRSFRRRSARGSRGVTDPAAYTPHSSIDGLTAAAGSGGSASAAAADVPHTAAAAASDGQLSATAGEGGASGGTRERGSKAAMPATASASAAGASDAGWDTADQKWDWGGLPNAEAAVKADVGAPSLMQQDGMGLAGVAESEEGLARRDSESGGALDAAAAGGQGMSGVVGGAGGYGGGASEFGEGMDQMRAQGSGMSGGAKPQTRSASGGSSRVGVQAVDHGLPEGLLAAGGDDAQAAVGVGRDESAGATTSDSTAERVAQVYGLGPEASGGVEEANVYQKEAGQEGHKDGGASKAFEGASGRDIE